MSEQDAEEHYAYLAEQAAHEAALDERHRLELDEQQRLELDAAELAAARAAGAAEERARIVAMLRTEAATWTERWNRTGGQAELAVADALDDMADRIERGEA